MTLSTKDITLISPVLTTSGNKGRLYYYQGNFHYPFNPQGSYGGKIKAAIRKFLRTHRELALADRADPDYLDPVQLMETLPCP